MPTKSELERKLGELRRQLEEKEQTIQQLREQLTQQQTQLVDVQIERDEALQAVQQYEFTLSEMSRETDVRVFHEVERVRQEMLAAHQREVQTQADLIGMLKDKLNVHDDYTMAGVGRSDDPHPSHDSSMGHLLGVSVATDVSDSEASRGAPSNEPTPVPRARAQLKPKPTPAPRKLLTRIGAHLPPLPMFGAADSDDGDALRRWVRKLSRHAELQQWTAHETLMQFELHLTGKAELLYEVLPTDVKSNLESAASALCKRMQPVQHVALASAQLMRRKQGIDESVDKYAQSFEQLFAKSYGNHTGMDSDSKALLKRDLFTQGLLRKWQEKILSSAETFHDVLFQARSAEEQEHTLMELHGPLSVRNAVVPPKRSTRPPDRDYVPQTSYRPPWSRPPGACFSCGKFGHIQKDCPLSKPQPEATGQPSKPANTISTPNNAQPKHQTRRDQLWKELTTLEFENLTDAYSGSKRVSTVTNSVGPLYYATVEIEGSLVDALVDPGSSATIMSFDLFQKIGENAHIPSTVLAKPTVTLKDYNQRTIPIGASADLTVSFNGKKVVAPVHICSPDSKVESCLLGTNVVMPLGLMVPSTGVQPRETNSDVASNSQITAAVHLIHSTRLPSRTGTIIEVRATCELPQHGPLFFEPGTDMLQSKGLALHSGLVECNEHGSIHLLVDNPTAECQELPKHVIVGCISECSITEYGELLDDCETSKKLYSAVQTVSVSQPDLNVMKRKQCLKELVQMSGDGLTEHDAELIRAQILQYHDVFSLQDGEYGKVDIVKHCVDTDNHHPINQALHRIPYAHRAEMFKLVQGMLDNHIIQPSVSPWSSPVVLVKKKDGSLRFCIDYRRLNAITRKDVFPMPRIDDMLEQLKGKKIFTTLDAKSGYWQVQMDPSSREKTAFRTSNGLYEFLVMPFGLCNAPATFQRLIQQVLSGMGNDTPFCCAYIDDILVYSDDVEQHVQHLQQVFLRLRSVGLLLHPKKCRFAEPSVLYLGHIVSKDGILPDPGKVSAVQQFPIPTTAKTVRQFLGLASYYRRFVPNFSKIAGPLYTLTKQTVPFQWTTSCQNSFERLKCLLATPPVLAYPDFSLSFVLQTDASGDGLGAVLEQDHNGQSHPVAYASRTISKHEANYSVTELEELAIVWALRHFRAYLLGHKCIVYTDHSPLKAVLAAPHSSGRRARWCDTLAEFDLEIRYKPGRANSNADALSRAPVCLVGAVTVDTLNVLQVDSSTDCNSRSIAQSQRDDPELAARICFMETGAVPDDDACAKQMMLDQSNFTLLEGVLYFIDPHSKQLRLALPRSVRQTILQESHSGAFSGHFAAHGLYKKLARQFWWKHMYSDVYHHCRSCLTCASFNGSGRRHHPPLKPIPVGAPFDRVGIDIMEMPLTQDGNRYVVVMMDYLTKWVEACAIPNQSSETLAKALVDNVICRHGVPKELLSDRGANLLSNLMLDICTLTGMKKINTTAYHPQTDGLVENFNRTLRTMLAKHSRTFGMDWDRHLQHLLFAYRTRPHDSTNEAPFFMIYGRDARLPTEAALSTPPTLQMLDVGDYKTELVTGLTHCWDIAHKSITKAQARQKKYYDQHTKTPTLKVGDRVMVFMPNETKTKEHKLSLPYHGPFRIMEVQGNCVLVRPVDRPEDKPILVSLDRTTLCPAELPDHSWLGTSRATVHKNCTTTTEQTPCHNHNTRSKVRGRTSN